MTTTPPEPPPGDAPTPGVTTPVLLDVLALALLILGATAVVVATFAVDWRAGTAALGAIAAAVGYRLSIREV